MDIDKRDIMNKLSAISDDELKNIVRAVARAFIMVWWLGG